MKIDIFGQLPKKLCYNMKYGQKYEKIDRRFIYVFAFAETFKRN